MKKKTALQSLHSKQQSRKMLPRNSVALLVLVLAGLSCATATLNPRAATAESTRKLLSRKRRYVAFPEGSSLSAALCLTIGVIGNPNVNYLSWAVNWGVAYDLPNYTWARQNAHGFKHDPHKSKPVVQRRSRRDLYEKIELAIENMGFNGHACIARALCESAKYVRRFQQRRGNMIEEIVKTIFSLPEQRVRSHEPEAVQHYDRIYRRGRRETRDCSAAYSECHFSLLELALGAYSVAPTKHGTVPMAASDMPLPADAFM